MPTEIIGSCGVGRFPYDRDQILLELELGITFLRRACPVPNGYSYEVVWRDHESGPYPEIGIVWDGPLPAPWEWISRAERALQRLDDAIEWSALEPEEDAEEGEEDGDDQPETTD
jgi:hypothetical protein